MAAANLVVAPKQIREVDQQIDLRQSHLLIQLEVETALKASQSATRMLEAALEEIRKMRGSL
ncbi:MAG: hypothetical protein ACR2JB_19070 [Bryobacteraceae bacterium]